MADPFVAEIRMFPFNFAPRGWAFCNGQLLPISQNTALFSLLGTTYGGDGRTTFALPNLQGRAAMAPGQGPGLTLRDLGETGGSETVALAVSQLPQHRHAVNTAGSPTTAVPVDALLAPVAGGAQAYRSAPAAASTTAMGIDALLPAGGGAAHDNRSPYLALNFCIAMQGIYPPRG